MSGQERKKSSVFSFPLKLDSDDGWLTAGGKQFQTRAVSTGNARLSIV